MACDADRGAAANTLTTLPGVELYPALSPDGNHVAFTWNGSNQDNPGIYVQTIGSGSPLRLTNDPRIDSNPVWSPDGRWIAFLRGEVAGPLSAGKRELLVVPPLGGPERKIADVRLQEYFPNPVYLAWAADSNALIVTNATGEGQPDALFAVSLGTGEKRQLTRPKPPVLADTGPAVSPDGRSLVFRRRVTWSHGELYVLPLEDGLEAAGEPRRLTPLAMAADYPAWMPDSKEILFSARGNLWRMNISAGSEPARLPFIGEDGSMPTVSRAQPGEPARLAYVRSFADVNIHRLEIADGGVASQPSVAIASTRRDTHPEFSPDNRRVAFTSTRSGEWEIWVSDPDGSNAVQLTSMRAQATGGPRWSPDGQRILFASDAEGQFENYEIAVTGGKSRRITSHPAFDHAPRYSADGKWIYFCSTRTAGYRVWKVPVAGGEPIQVTKNEGFVSYETPDGSFLYYTEGTAIGSPLWRMPASGGEPVKVLDGIVWWNFVVRDNGIYYVGTEARLHFFDFTTRISTTISPNLGNVDSGMSVSRDGRTLLVTRADSSVDDLMLVENFR